MNCKAIYDTLYREYGTQHWWPARTRDEVVIGAVLTQNTSWANVEKAIANLYTAGLCEIHKIRELDLVVLAEYIRPAGYFNVKAKRLKNVCTQIQTELLKNAELHIARESLLAINGVGKETADSILLYAFDRAIFVIDAYTTRIFGRLGLALKDYDAYQDFFMSNLKHDVTIFNEYHALIVWHGKHFCKTKPLCDKCCLSKHCETKGISK